VYAPASSNGDDDEPNRFLNRVSIFPFAYDLKKAVRKEQKADNPDDSHGSFTTSRKLMLRIGCRVAQFPGRSVKEKAASFITYIMMSRKLPASEKPTNEGNQHKGNDTDFFHG